MVLTPYSGGFQSHFLCCWITMLLIRSKLLFWGKLYELIIVSYQILQIHRASRAPSRIILIILLWYCSGFYVLGLASYIWLISVPGIYPPQMKVFELRELSLKFESHLVPEIINFQVMYQIDNSENLYSFMLLILCSSILILVKFINLIVCSEHHLMCFLIYNTFRIFSALF